MATRKSKTTITPPRDDRSDDGLESLPADRRMQDALLDHIRERAYHLSLRRNGGAGDPTADWLQAERELLGSLGG